MLQNEWKNEYRQISIDDLVLDIKNPRTNTGEKQSSEDVERELLDENILDLIESISKKGFAAASVSMVVLERGKSVVIDGNRRLFAVKILDNPDIVRRYVPDVLSSSEFEKMKGLATVKKELVDSLTAIVYPSRAEAEKEMSILHLDGEAVKKWKPLRQFRYFQDRIRSEKMSIVDFSESSGISVKRIKEGLTTIQLYQKAKEALNLGELQETIFNDKKFRTDKFQKTVVNEEGERFLGYHFDEGIASIVIMDEKTFLVRMERILRELYDSDSSFFSSAQYPVGNRVGFFRSVDPKFLSSKERQSSEKKMEKEWNDNGQDLFGDSVKKNGASSVGSDEKDDKSERSEKKPSGLFVSSRVPYKLGNSALRMIYDELKSIDVLKYPNATHDLLRSFLECSLAEFLTAKEEYAKIAKSDRYSPKLGELITYIVNQSDIITDRAVLDNLKDVKSDWDQPYSLQRMNKVNHNKDYASSEGDVRVAWAKLESLFKIILNPDSTKKK